jgi:hypothetical protein
MIMPWATNLVYTKIENLTIKLIEFILKNGKKAQVKITINVLILFKYRAHI